MELTPTLTSSSFVPCAEDATKCQKKPFKIKKLEMNLMSNEEIKNTNGSSLTESSPDSAPSTATTFPHEPASEVRGVDIDFEDLRYTSKRGIIRRGR